MSCGHEYIYESTTGKELQFLSLRLKIIEEGGALSKAGSALGKNGGAHSKMADACSTSPCDIIDDVLVSIDFANHF